MSVHCDSYRDYKAHFWPHITHLLYKVHKTVAIRDDNETLLHSLVLIYSLIVVVNCWRSILALPGLMHHWKCVHKYLNVYHQSWFGCMRWHIKWPNFVRVSLCVCTSVRLSGSALMGLQPSHCWQKINDPLGRPNIATSVHRESKRGGGGIKACGRLTHCKHYGFMSVAYDRDVTHLLSLGLDFYCEL